MAKYMLKSEFSQHVKDGQGIGVSASDTYDQLRANGWQIEGDPNPISTPTEPPVLSRIGQDIKSRADQLNVAAGDIHTGNLGQDVKNFPGAALRATGALVGGIADVATEPVKSVLNNPVVAGTQHLLNKYISPFVIGMNPEDLAPAMQKATETYQGWAQKHPDAAKNLQALGDVGRFGLTISAAEQMGNALGMGMNAQEVPVAIQDIPKKVKQGVGSIKGKFMQTITNSADPWQTSVMPPTTKAEMANASPSLRNKGSFFNAPSLSPSEEQIGLTDIAKSLQENGYDPLAGPIENAKVVHNAWGNEAENLQREMSANERLQAVKTPDEEYLNSIRKELVKAGQDPAKTSAGAKIMSVAEDSLNGASNGKPTGGWKSKIDFSKEAIRKWGDSIYDKGTDTADAVNAAHDGFNNVIKNATENMGVDYAGKMDRLTQMQRLLQNFKSQIKGTPLRSTFGTIVRNPYVRTGVAVIGGEELLRHGSHLLP